VVVFNLTRFARHKYDHFAWRSLLQSLGISLRSVTGPIDDTSTGKLMDGIRALRQQRAFRTHAWRHQGARTWTPTGIRMDRSDR
jgi:DNA invertase Pin-like site-specific DNA recombinase